METTPSAEIHIGYASFEIDKDLHLSIGRRYNATLEELDQMKEFVERVIKKLMPFHITFGNFCHVGELNTIPAYRVYFNHHVETNILREFYNMFYQEAPNKAIYSVPEYHITVDTYEKRERLESIITQHRRNCQNAMSVAEMYEKADFSSRQAPNEINLYYPLNKVDFKHRVEGGAVEVTATAWKCPICKNRNPLREKACLGDDCDQWRPLSIVDNPSLANNSNSYSNDWMCCGYKNFGNRDRCAKCNNPRNAISNSNNMNSDNNYGNSSVPSIYEKAPSAPPHYDITQLEVSSAASNHPKESNNKISAYGNDWWCHKCQFKIYGKKEECFKCHSRRPN